MEIWKPLIYPGINEQNNKFEISSDGRLRNKLTNKIYKPTVLTSGYYSVKTSLGSRKIKKHIIIHKAVAYTFIPNPNNYPEINHIDGNKLNNSINNLEWCSSHHNQQHKYDIGLYDVSKIQGENNPSHKLTESDVHYIREHYIKGSKEFGERALSRKFNVARRTICSIINMKTWTHI